MTVFIFYLSNGALCDGCYVPTLRGFANILIREVPYGGDICDNGAVDAELHQNRVKVRVIGHDGSTMNKNQAPLTSSNSLEPAKFNIQPSHYRDLIFGTPLSRPAREQLAKIHELVLAGGKAEAKRSGLRNLILNNIFNPVRGIYIPVSQNTIR